MLESATLEMNMQKQANDQAGTEVSAEMIEAGARVIDEWGSIEDPHALALRVYNAMVHADQPSEPVSLELPSGSATADRH